MSGSFAQPSAPAVAFIPFTAQPIFQPGALITDPAVQTAQANAILVQQQQANAAIVAQQQADADRALAASNAAAAATLAAQQEASAKAAVIPLTGQSNSFAPGTAPGTVGSLNNNAAGTGLLSPAGENNLAKLSTPGNSTPTVPTTPTTPLVPTTPTLPVAPLPDLLVTTQPFTTPTDLTLGSAPVVPPVAPAAPLVLSLNDTAPSDNIITNNVQPDNITTTPVFNDLPAPSDTSPTVFGMAPLTPIDPPPAVQAIINSGTSLTPTDNTDPLNNFQPSTTVATDQAVTGTVNPDIVSPTTVFGALPLAPDVSNVIAATNGDTITATAGNDTSTPIAFISSDRTTITTTNPNSGVATTDPLADPSPPIISSDTDVLRTASATATIVASQVRASLGLLPQPDNLINIANAVHRNRGAISNVLTDVSNQMGVGPAQGEPNQIAAFVQGAMVQAEGQPPPDGTVVGNDFQDLVAPPVVQSISNNDPVATPSTGRGGGHNNIDAQGGGFHGNHHQDHNQG